MKNILLKLAFIATSCLTASCGLFGETNSQYNFRNSKWGMSVDEVKEVETADLIREDVGENQNTDLLYYGNFQMYDEDVQAVYVFWTKDKKLGKCLYEFENGLKENKIKKILCDLVEKYYDQNNYSALNSVSMYGKSKDEVKNMINKNDYNVIVDNDFLVAFPLDNVFICMSSSIVENDSTKTYVTISYESKKYNKYTGSDQL